MLPSYGRTRQLKVADPCVPVVSVAVTVTADLDRTRV
jgi:hypothetical protein